MAAKCVECGGKGCIRIHSGKVPLSDGKEKTHPENVGKDYCPDCYEKTAYQRTIQGLIDEANGVKK